MCVQVEVPVVRLLEAAQELGQDQTLTSKKCALLKEQVSHRLHRK